MQEHAQGVHRKRSGFGLRARGSIAAWLRWLLQYRRGGNRPITCRLLICSTQTAAVLPPMRNPWTPGLFPLCLRCIYLRSSIEDSIPLGLTLRYSIVPGLLRPFSCSYSIPLSTFFVVLLVLAGVVFFFLPQYPLATR